MEVCQPFLYDGTTDHCIPLSKRCRFSNPQRIGIFALAFLKLVLSLGLLIIIIFTLLLFLIFSIQQLLYHIIVLICFAIFIDLVDIFIGLVIIISVCMKHPGIMEAYYRYTIYVFGSLTVLCCLISYMAGYYFFVKTYILSKHIIAMSIIFSILFSILMMQVGLNHMVKNEVLKLRGNAQFLL